MPFQDKRVKELVPGDRFIHPEYEKLVECTDIQPEDVHVDKDWWTVDYVDVKGVHDQGSWIDGEDILQVMQRSE